jgi:hypothetical protein
LIDHALVCGLFFGAAVELVMRLIVPPLSALHAMGPYTYRDLVLGLLIHMIVIGLPISFSVQWFTKPHTARSTSTGDSSVSFSG